MRPADMGYTHWYRQEDLDDERRSLLTLLYRRAYPTRMGTETTRALKEATSGSQSVPPEAPGVPSFSARGIA